MRFDDLIKRPSKPQRPLTYTESLQAKLNNELGVTPTEDLDEGWKDVAAAGALATGLAFGGGAQAKQPHAPVPHKAPQTHVAQKQQQPVQQKLQTLQPKAQQPAPKAQQPAPKADQGINILSNNSKAEELLHRAALKAGIRGTELAQFLAQTSHESADFSRMKEFGGKDYFHNRYDPKTAPKTAKILGNVKPGDGVRYHGRGFIQITGRDNYRMAGEALGLPLEQKPELAATPTVAAKIAVWYWQTRVKPHVANFNDTAAVTKAINPALRGLQDRLAKFQDYKRIL